MMACGAKVQRAVAATSHAGRAKMQEDPDRDCRMHVRTTMRVTLGDPAFAALCGTDWDVDAECWRLGGRGSGGRGRGVRRGKCVTNGRKMSGKGRKGPDRRWRRGKRRRSRALGGLYLCAFARLLQEGVLGVAGRMLGAELRGVYAAGVGYRRALREEDHGEDRDQCQQGRS